MTDNKQDIKKEDVEQEVVGEVQIESKSKTLYISIIATIVSIVIMMLITGGLFVLFNYYLVVSSPNPRKPAIYLYPTKPTKVNVTIDKNIDLTIDIPKYVASKGWNVLAHPDGKIVDLQAQYTNCNELDVNRFGMQYAKEACVKNNYPYIYWEGTPKTKQLPAQTKGWLVKTANIKEFLETKLDYVGFNKAEKDEFIRYWEHKIFEGEQDMVFISFMQTNAVDAYLSMTINPSPDSINRFYIVVDFNIERHENPAPQELTKFNRKGFTVVDWGGCVIAQNFIR